VENVKGFYPIEGFTVLLLLITGLTGCNFVGDIFSPEAFLYRLGAESKLTSYLVDAEQIDGNLFSGTSYGGKVYLIKSMDNDVEAICLMDEKEFVLDYTYSVRPPAVNLCESYRVVHAFSDKWGTTCVTGLSGDRIRIPSQGTTAEYIPPEDYEYNYMQFYFSFNSKDYIILFDRSPLSGAEIIEREGGTSVVTFPRLEGYMFWDFEYNQELQKLYIVFIPYHSTESIDESFRAPVTVKIAVLTLSDISSWTSEGFPYGGKEITLYMEKEIWWSETKENNGIWYNIPHDLICSIGKEGILFYMGYYGLDSSYLFSHDGSLKMILPSESGYTKRRFISSTEPIFYDLRGGTIFKYAIKEVVK